MSEICVFFAVFISTHLIVALNPRKGCSLWHSLRNFVSN